MLGLNAAAEIDPTITSLAPGDTALLYTDGLHSSKADNGERLTADAVADAFARLGASADFLPRLVGELDQTSADRSFDDDVAAIAVRRE
jgi:serine phosphatase RsbU (regulator of sigma subunit)